MNEQILKVSNLSHRYNVKWAIKDINISISNRGIYGLLGSNGAGKSTLMNITCGVIRQTEGEVEISGINTILNPVESKRKIGFLPQKPPLHPEKTILEYLDFCAALRDIPADKTEAAIKRVMDICGLNHMKERVIKSLSGGFQQRVGIAQAIIHEPDIVILDEPTNGLDPNQILEVRSVIRDIAKERTVILSTHILSEVQAICDRIIMIEHGNIIFNGTTVEFDNYLSPDSIFVQLLQMPPTEELEKINGVIGIESISETEYRIKSSDVNETIRAINKLNLEKNWDLMKIYPEKNSMNDVFAALSQNAK